MTPFLLFLALGAAAPDGQSSGTLVGCAFLAEGATEERHTFLGLGVYLPSRRLKGPLPASLISDPNGFLGGSGFDKVESTSGSITFKGEKSLRLQHSGGGLYEAHLDGVAGRGSCQLGQFPDRDSAFDFFDQVIHGASTPQ